MEELNKKVIWNAISAYFLFFVSLAFLWSKDKHIWHSFVKGHVRVAFTLHIIFIIMLFIMSYPIGVSISILWYSINTIIKIFLSLTIFSWIFYGAFMASKWKTLTIREIFHSGTGKSWELYSTTKTEDIGEETKSLLALMHIPFIWYILAPSHRDLPRARDIIQMNFILTCICVIMYILGLWNLATLIFLVYIIWSVFAAINLFTRDELIAPNLHIVPTVIEKYILQRSLLKYVRNMLFKKPFITLDTIKVSQEKIISDREELYKNITLKYKDAPIASSIFYIPLVNIIWIFFLKTKDTYHIRNGLVITVFTLILWYVYGVNHPSMLLLLFPISYGIGNLYKKEYVMPYIDDISRVLIACIYNTTHIFSKARTLQKTEIKESIKMNEEKK